MARAVTQVPMLAPKIRAMPVSSETNPWPARTMITPVVADELWTTAVNTAPRRMPSSGFSMLCIRLMNGS